MTTEDISAPRITRILGRGLVWLMVVLLTLWAAAALYFDLSHA
jgi:hypothetical protein